MSGPFYPGQRVVAVDFPEHNGEMARVVKWSRTKRWLRVHWFNSTPGFPGEFGVSDYRFRAFEGELSPVERYIADELGAALD